MARKIYVFVMIVVVVGKFAGASWGDAPANTSARIRWIQDRLDRAAGPSRTWQYGWTTAYGGMTYLYAVQASTLDDDNDDDERYDAAVNAVTSSLGLAAALAAPLTTWNAGRHLKQLPETTDDEKEAKLRYAEGLLRRCAQREQRGRSWTAHALAGLVSLASGVAVACDGDRTGDGLAMFAGGMLVSELQILSQPTHAMRAWKEYQSGMPQERVNTMWQNLSLSSFHRGLAVHLRF